MTTTKNPITWPNGQSKEILASVTYSELQIRALFMQQTLEGLKNLNQRINLHTVFNSDNSITVHVCNGNYEASMDFKGALERMLIVDENIAQ